MKRVLILTLLCVISLSAFAGTLSGDVVEKYYEEYYEFSNSVYSYFINKNPWSFGYYTDDFGDETNDVYLYYVGRGSYTTESSVDSTMFYYIITVDSDGVSFYLLSSFGSNLANNSIKGTFEVAYKVDTTTVRASGIFDTKKAVFTDSSASEAFKKVLKEGKDVKVIITQDGTVFESKKFNLGTIKNSTYNSALDEAYYCTITYDANSGNGSIKNVKIMKGEKVTINDGLSLSKDRFEFVGWNTSSNGKGQSCKAGDVVILKGNVTLYAQWEHKRGPAGGYVFYDCDADNNSGNADGLISSECGWRYLEAAPEDLGRYPFGYYRPDGKTNTEIGTSTALGAGKGNTEVLVNAMGETTYTYYSTTSTTKGTYAAKVCAEYTLNGYDDWFLPSKDELDLMYENLNKQGVGSFVERTYWSSSECSNDYAWCQNFFTGDQSNDDRSSASVRPIRAFSVCSDGISEHKIDAGVITKEPTCTEEGIKTYTCTVCGQVAKVEVITAKGHTSDSGKVTKQPTCVQTGAKTYTCTVCGQVIKTESIPIVAHTYVDYRCIDCGIWSKGPAGGYIFYDCDADNDSGNADGLISSACGWRYLEASPVKLPDPYGYGASGYAKKTKTYIGSGQENTERILKKTGKTNSAANACSDYKLNGYDDWFLPSIDELKAMYNYLEANGVYFSNTVYWSSSEYSSTFTWCLDFNNGTQHTDDHDIRHLVWPIRAFND